MAKFLRDNPDIVIFLLFLVFLSVLMIGIPVATYQANSRYRLCLEQGYSPEDCG